jgi:agmatinase
MLSSLRVILGAAAIVAAHGGHDHDQVPIEGPHKSLWYNSLPGDGGTQASVEEY